MMVSHYGGGAQEALAGDQGSRDPAVAQCCCAVLVTSEERTLFLVQTCAYPRMVPGD